MLDQIEPEEVLKEIPNLKETATSVSRGIHDWVLKGGEPRRELVDKLHGVRMGHPLHPVLTDVTIGAWIFSVVLDLLSLTTRSRGVEKAADTLLVIGNVSAVGTAMAGVADFSTIPQSAVSTGAVHGMLNATGLALNLLSWRRRRQGRRGRGILISMVTQGILLASAWLGGELVYKYKVGVNRIPGASGPNDWTAVMDDGDLPEMTPRRVEVKGTPVLLYRYRGEVLAMGAVCGHEGAPLERGKFDGYCVECPWHQSVYDLRDGSVVHGPTTYAEPVYAARMLNGKIELRLVPNETTADLAQKLGQLRDQLAQDA